MRPQGCHAGGGIVSQARALASMAAVVEAIRPGDQGKSAVRAHPAAPAVVAFVVVAAAAALIAVKVALQVESSAQKGGGGPPH